MIMRLSKSFSSLRTSCPIKYFCFPGSVGAGFSAYTATTGYSSSDWQDEVLKRNKEINLAARRPHTASKSWIKTILAFLLVSSDYKIDFHNSFI